MEWTPASVATTDDPTLILLRHAVLVASHFLLEIMAKMEVPQEFMRRVQLSFTQAEASVSRVSMDMFQTPSKFKEAGVR